VTKDSRDIAELHELAATAGAKCMNTVTGKRQFPDPHFFVGSGKAAEIREAVHQRNAELVIFGHDILPSQERNLEAFLQCRVIDRTGLILDIFAQRARSFEGKLQVELAQLRHLATRLVRGWTHLERQKGGIGLRGPGETQLETDRRLVAERIKRIKQQLHKVERQRHQGRQSRHKANVSVVSLVGYTNAGKSTLFNQLTNAGVVTADQLFATLDPTFRKLNLPNAEPVIVVDTVGFISQLPHELIAAFRATLQETCEAHLLLHVIDASDPNHREQAETVQQVLQEIGADKVPRIEVFNKIDRLQQPPRLKRQENQKSKAVWVSATSGAGMELLLETIAGSIRDDMIHGWLRLPPEAGRTRARLFALKAVISEQVNPSGEWLIEVQTTRNNFKQLCHSEGLDEQCLYSIFPDDACSKPLQFPTITYF
jgi:GTP-binding protein HflX